MCRSKSTSTNLLPLSWTCCSRPGGAKGSEPLHGGNITFRVNGIIAFKFYTFHNQMITSIIWSLMRRRPVHGHSYAPYPAPPICTPSISSPPHPIQPHPSAPHPSPPIRTPSIMHGNNPVDTHNALELRFIIIIIQQAMDYMYFILFFMFSFKQV